MNDISKPLPAALTAPLHESEGADRFRTLGGERRLERKEEAPKGESLGARVEVLEGYPLPHNMLAEAEVVAYLVRTPGNAALIPQLEPQHFAVQALGEIFEAIRASHRNGEAVSPSTIARHKPAIMKAVRVGSGVMPPMEFFGSLYATAYAIQPPDLLDRAGEIIGHAALREIAARIAEGRGIDEVAPMLDEAMSLQAPAFALRHPLRDPQPVKERPWIVPKLLMRGEVTLLVGPPGTGKSTLLIQIAHALASGLSWGAFSIAKPFRVLLLHVEDDAAEIDRKLAACREVMPGAVVETSNLATLYSDEEPMLARFDERAKEIIATAAFARFEALVKEHRADVVIVDPVSGIYEGDETNPAFKALARLFRKLARRCNCAVALVHHTRKGAGDMAGDLDASRGGSTLAGRVRVGMTIFAMTDDEAKLHGINPAERRQYCRLDDAKQSYGSISGSGAWFRLEPTIVFAGDDPKRPVEVATFKPWQPGGLFEGIDNPTIHTILAEIDRGVIGDDGKPTGELYQPRPDATHWGGEVIMRRVPGCLSVRAKAILETWKQSRLLVEAEFTNRQSKLRKGLKSVPARWPGAIS